MELGALNAELDMCMESMSSIRRVKKQVLSRMKNFFEAFPSNPEGEAESKDEDES